MTLWALNNFLFPVLSQETWARVHEPSNIVVLFHVFLNYNLFLSDVNALRRISWLESIRPRLNMKCSISNRKKQKVSISRLRAASVRAGG